MIETYTTEQEKGRRGRTFVNTEWIETKLIQHSQPSPVIRKERISGSLVVESFNFSDDKLPSQLKKVFIF